MKFATSSLCAVLFGSMFPALLAGLAAGAENPFSAEAIKTRIEKHRQADAVVTVVDAEGNPVPGADMRIEQTRHAFLFGSNIYAWGRFDDEQFEQQYRSRFAEVFNFATLGFYWWSYEREQGEPMYDYTEKVARWCREHGITVKGHPLAWNHSEPAWLPDDLDAVRRLQYQRIEDCVKRFRGVIDIWDVVNEPTHFERDHFQRRAPKLTNMWAETGRVEFTRECFERARRANPEATLLINDYRTGEPYADIIEQLVDDQGRPLYDVIGIQSHMHGGVWSNEQIWQTCQRYAPFGKPIHFTETTIISGERAWRGDDHGRPWPTTPEGEQYQAREVERFYTLLFSHPAVEAITWWDFSDARAWKQAPAGFLRKDMSPKPAYHTLHNLIKKEWWTRAERTADEQGRVRFRGFLGEYRVTAVGPDGSTTKASLQLTKDEPATVRISLP